MSRYTQGSQVVIPPKCANLQDPDLTAEHLLHKKMARPVSRNRIVQKTLNLALVLGLYLSPQQPSDCTVQ